MRLKFYDESDHRCVYNVYEMISNGSYGYIYRYADDECLKHIRNNYRYDIRAIKKIMELNLDNVYEIKDLLYDENKDFTGYTMKYYDKNNMDVLNEPVEYTIDNYYRLRDTVKKISDEFIMMIDLHNENVLLLKDKIMIIDIDLYAKGVSDANAMFNYNYRLLMSMFRGLYIDELRNRFDYYDIDRTIIEDLFNPKEDGELMVKKLKKYKYPQDYIEFSRRNMGRLF